MEPNLNRTQAVPHLKTVSTTSAPESAASENRTYSFDCDNSVPIQETSGKTPTLPNFNPKFSKPRPVAAPTLDNPLPHRNVAGWEAELQQIVQQVRDIYIEGPMVDGWLESYAYEEPGTTDHLTGYRLCGLDAAGKMWFHPCPPEQLPSVSIAIARYQQLLQLLERKHYIETGISELDNPEG